MEDYRAQLESLGRVLIWCFALSIALLIVWSVFYLLLGRWVFGIHSNIFEMTERDFDLIMYCGMGLLKVAAFVLFLIPYISVRLVLRRA
jgi:hypothetical protein